MRASSRRTHQEEEEESAFVSMTDMTVSFLFIVILLLAFFASQYSDTDQVPRSELVAERSFGRLQNARLKIFVSRLSKKTQGSANLKRL
ncbi:hypothetical protein [Pannonibacter phragmitetus]|uniref:hypothetical protein n=1 Tax=Pannonibacter phragmitetus TaxID=121719 RepID=UPI003D2F49EF